MRAYLQRNRQNAVGVGVVLVALIAGLAFIAARQPDPGTAKYVASKVHDPPDDCQAPDIMPLDNEDLTAWKHRAERSAIIVCGDAGPGLQWAHFASPDTLEAALRTASGAPGFVCRARVDLIRMNGFPRSSEIATCKALNGQQVRQ